MCVCVSCVTKMSAEQERVAFQDQACVTHAKSTVAENSSSVGAAPKALLGWIDVPTTSTFGLKMHSVRSSPVARRITPVFHKAKCSRLAVNKIP